MIPHNIRNRKLFLILFGIRNMLEIVPNIAQSTHGGIRNIFADIRNVPTRPHMVLGMFLLAFPVSLDSNSSSAIIPHLLLQWLSFCEQFAIFCLWSILLC
jgi:hypothetical protein